MPDHAALQPCLQAAHHGLDLGEFRHGCGCRLYTASHERQSPAAAETTDFGFRTVPGDAKKPLVRAVFDSVAPRYDLMNDLMSLGIHRAWKRIFVTALRSARRSARCSTWPAAPAISAFGWLARGGGPVIAVGHQRRDAGGRPRPRARARRWSPDSRLLVADAERLPLPDRARRYRLDRVRPAQLHRQGTRCCAEARRVLKPGGRFLCLEFSRLQVAALAPLYDAWSFRVLPRLGQVVAGDADSYRYLAESIRTFPGPGDAGRR